MKKSLLFVLFALVSMVSYSQISWNVKAGMNMSNITGDADTDLRIGFNAGVGMEYQFTDTWSIQPSLMFSQKGFKLGDVKCNPLYLEVPVLAAARFAVTDNQNVVVKAGPYLAVGIAGKSKVEEGNVTVKTDYFGDNAAKRFYFGLGFGVAYEIGQIFFGLDGGIGFIDALDGGIANIVLGSSKNMNFSLGVGYKF